MNYFLILNLILSLFIKSTSSFIYNYNQPSIQLRTKFNDISFRHGLKHIHTPEHVKYTHYFGAPFFNIHSVGKPTNLNNITSVKFKCSVMNLNKMTVIMHSQYTNRCEMNFYIDNDNDNDNDNDRNQKEFITLQITILPDLNNKNNHYFFLRVFLNDFLSFFIPFVKIFFQLSMFISTKEDIIFFFNKNRNSKIIYNEQLNEYRKLIYSKLRK
jgi:hypothetical protein